MMWKQKKKQETHEGLGASKERRRCINLKDDDDEEEEEDERMMSMSPHGWDIATAPF